MILYSMKVESFKLLSSIRGVRYEHTALVRQIEHYVSIVQQSQQHAHIL